MWRRLAALLVQAVAHDVIYLIGPAFAEHPDRLPRQPHEAYWAAALLVLVWSAAAVVAALVGRDFSPWQYAAKR